jgi:hypothetical protein
MWPPFGFPIKAVTWRGYKSDKSSILVVPVERIELPTFGLQNRCSTAELNRRTNFNRRWKKLPDRLPLGTERSRRPSDIRVVQPGLQAETRSGPANRPSGHRAANASPGRRIGHVRPRSVTGEASSLLHADDAKLMASAFQQKNPRLLCGRGELLGVGVVTSRNVTNCHVTASHGWGLLSARQRTLEPKILLAVDNRLGVCIF